MPFKSFKRPPKQYPKGHCNYNIRNGIATVVKRSLK
jgi:hypothetical protein